ncbi:MAG: SIR2 family NAD-dependent protein deacylase [Bacillota bacterium]
MSIGEKIIKLADLMVESKKTMILTGAGISTESGIPDFRGPDGLWNKVDPLYVFSAETFIYRPEVFYKAGMPLMGPLQAAVPNAAHIVIAELEKSGLVDAVITQNIDGLHQRAGSEKVYELHGHLRSASCINCGSKISWQELEGMVLEGHIPPRHSQCGGVYKPDTVFFGDSLPHDFYHCCKEAAESDLMVVVGSSLEVSPVNYLPSLCKQLAIVNLGGTMEDHRAVLKIEARAGEAFTELARVLKDRGKLKYDEGLLA